MALHLADYGYVLEVGPHRDGRLPARACSRRTTSRSSISASRTRASAAPDAGSERRCGDERGAPTMSVVAQRPAGPGGGRGLDRPRAGHPAQALPPGGEGARRPGRHAREEPRDLALDHLAGVRRQGPARGSGTGRPRTPARRRGVDRRGQPPGVALHRSRHHLGGRRHQRHLHHRFAEAGRVHRQRQRHALLLRGERGAARQDPRGAGPLPAARQDLRVRPGRAPRLPGRSGDAVPGLARAGRALRARPSGKLRSRSWRSPSPRIWPFSCTPRAPPVPRRAPC